MSTRTLLVAGERRRAALVEQRAEVPGDVDLAYGLVAGERAGWTSLGPTPLLERRLRLSRLLPVPLLAPFGWRPRKGFRELEVVDPRMSRLWGRFAVDVRVAIERDAKFLGARVFDRGGYRVFIVEDGDRYAIRAMCIFTVRDSVGYVVELLHDRTIEGMRDALHVLGLALRAMSDAGAEVARACSLSQGGAAPMLLLHGFRRARSGPRLAVRAIDGAIDDVVTDAELWYVSYLDFDEP